MDHHGFQIVEWDLVLTDVDTPNQQKRPEKNQINP